MAQSSTGKTRASSRALRHDLEVCRDVTLLDARDKYLLGVSLGASRDDIRRAYRERMKQFHPDVLEHIGMSEVGVKASQEITESYNNLKRMWT